MQRWTLLSDTVPKQSTGYHLDNSFLPDMSKLSTAFLRLGKYMNPLLVTWRMCLIRVVANLDDLQQFQLT